MIVAENYTLPKNTTTILKMSYKENTIWFIEWKKTNGILGQAWR